VSHHHRLVEKYQSLFIHLEMMGKDIVGSPELFSRLAKVTRKNPFFSRRVEPGLAEFMTGMLESFFGDAPSPKEWSGWVRCFRHIAFLISGTMADRNSRRNRTAQLRERYFSNMDFDFRDFFEASRKRAASVVTLAHDYFELPRFDEADRERFAIDSALDSLAYPDVASHPEARVVALGHGASGEPAADVPICAALPG
jgi:hypothetical protein